MTRRAIVAAGVAAIVAALALALAGCGSGQMTSQIRDVGEVSRVRAEGKIDVEVRAGAPRRVEVRAGEKVIDDVATEVDGDTLVVRTESRGLVIGSDGFDDSRVVVQLPELQSVDSDGSSDIEVAGLDGGTLAASVDGSGDLEARGRVSALDLTVDGSGDADLVRLAARRVRVEVHGSGDAEVQALDVLEAVAEGSGSIRYRGRPRVQMSRTRGSGDISQD